MPSKILLIDSFDSFTYNLYHYLDQLNRGGVEVIRNDQITLEKANQFSKIVLSPGPGLPEEAGNLIQVLEAIKNNKKVLGICLGMQAIAQVFGAKLINLKKVVHGQSCTIEIDQEEPLFKGLPRKILVGRYHSWIVNSEALPEELIVTSKDSEGNIMSLRHKDLPVKGVQFHPESILSLYGKELMRNWIE